MLTVYSAYFIIVPLKEFRPDNVQLFYSNITIPQVTELYVDFFDMNFNYVGSYDVYGNNL